VTPHQAARRYALISGLTWLPTGLGMATMLLLMNVRGLGLADVGIVFAVYSITVTVLELPTGGLADVIGRRSVLAASALIGTVSIAGTAFATTLWQFVALTALRAVSRALSSGPAEAWYVDTVHATEGADSLDASRPGLGAFADRAADLRGGLAKGSAAGTAALAVGVLIGGAIPLAASATNATSATADTAAATGSALTAVLTAVVPMAVPTLLAAVASAVLLVVCLVAMPEPPRPGPRPTVKQVLTGVPRTVIDSAKLGLRDRLLTKVLLTSLALGVALNSVELFTPGRLAAITGHPTTAGMAYAIVTAIGFAASTAGASVSPWLARRLGNHPAQRTAAVGTVISAAALGGLAATGGVGGVAGIVAAATAYSGMFFGLGVTNPMRSELVHQRVSATERATVLSVASLLLQFGGTVGAAVLGPLAQVWSVPPAWWIAAAVLAVSALLYWSRHPVGARVEVHPPGAQETDQRHAELAGQVDG
jgi:MFS family permease